MGREYRCLKCKHTWESRIKTKPIQCPNCKNTTWDKQRK